MTGDGTFNTLLIALFVLAPVSFLSLLYANAPYGRHARSRSGPTLPIRAAWVVMESPTILVFGYFFATGPNAGHVVPLVLLAMWAAHYVHRTLVYPFQMRVGRVTTMSAGVVAMGFGFQLVNCYLNATWISTHGSYPTAWLADPRFVVGLALFATGYVINRQSDEILRNLRKPGDSEYKIPTGGLYGWISCPNYFGELVTWVGWAVATWSLAGLAFAVFTAANLVPRALANHRWYRKTFDDYPAERRAIVPFVL